MVVVDGTNMIFGRISSQIAKAVLRGDTIHLINSEMMVLSGNPKATHANFKARRAAQHKGTPEHSPKWPRVPYLLVKRMIRGMLPWKSTRGKAAHRRLIVYTGNPKKLVADSKFEKCEPKKGSKYIRILDLCRLIGYSG